MTKKFRTESDSMGELQLPAEALYGAQTQRAVNNFPISGIPLPRQMIRALGLLKLACARANHNLGLLDSLRLEAIEQAAMQVAEGLLDDQFPVDIFQTGSGTSSNMNINEVISNLASSKDLKVHPNDHVNMGQSSNDVFPSAIHIGSSLAIHEQLIPALAHLQKTLEAKGDSLGNVVTTGRTHLMDAMPITLAQEISGWQEQIKLGLYRIQSSLTRLQKLALGGTAVGTGINAHEDFADSVSHELKLLTGIKFSPKENFFEGLSAQDAAVEMSGQLKTVAVSMMKLSNDLRWMNSGPLAGIAEIALPELQPGSSIMPGKVNPVIPEAVAMVCAQVIGNDVTVTMGGQSGNFQLNVMLPVIAYNLIQSIELLANAANVLADKAIKDFRVNEDKINMALAANPILVTALNPVIGYELGAKIAKKAYAESRPVLEVAREMTDLSEEELTTLLDPARLTKGGLDPA
jgi:fumarate hydratase class II